MRKVFWAILLISGTALAQAGRYDSNAWTAATNVPIGKQAPIFTIPYASITICTDSSCDTPVAIYLDRAESQPIVQPFQADAFGKFGFWANSGTYWYEACSPAGDCDTGWLTVGSSGEAARNWSCQPGVGDGLHALPAGTYATTTCRNETGSPITLTSIRCVDDVGTSTCNVTNGAGTALLTGAVTATATYATGTQSSTVTLAPGDYLKITYILDGTTAQIGLDASGTY